MNDASQEIDEEKTPDVGTRIQFDGLQLVVMMRNDIRGSTSSCDQCWGSSLQSGFCTELPRCGIAGYPNARLFVPDLEHEPTVQRVALMRLRGEL